MTMTDRTNNGVMLDQQDFWSCRIPLHDLKLPLPVEVHAWYLDLADLARSLQGALGSENENAAAPAFTPGQLLFARRFYLRLLLGAYLGVPGKSVKINRRNRGKPVLDRAEHDSDLHFSTAKSEGKLLIGFSTHSYVGVDLEPAQRVARNPMGVARRYFSPAEADALAAMPADVRDAVFLRAWACKEAVVKASGQGIANQLCRFSVDMNPANPAALLDIEGENAADWSLALIRPGEGFLGAVACRDAAMKIRGFRLLSALPPTGP
jgi:4'-phosphopantetheinyl transferase